MAKASVGSKIGLQVQAEVECVLSLLRSDGEVHEARKAIRRARSLLALADGELEIGPADVALQRAGDSLSMLRDLRAATGTAMQLSEQDGISAWDVVVAALHKRTAILCRDTLHEDPGFKKRIAMVRQARRSIAKLDWADFKPRHLDNALQRQERKTQKSAKRAESKPVPDNLHRWRRKSRRLRMQIDALKDLNIEHVKLQKHAAKSLHKLSDALGGYQDLVVLSEEIEGIQHFAGRRELLENIDQLRNQQVRTFQFGEPGIS